MGSIVHSIVLLRSIGQISGVMDSNVVNIADAVTVVSMILGLCIAEWLHGPLMGLQQRPRRGG